MNNTMPLKNLPTNIKVVLVALLVIIAGLTTAVIMLAGNKTKNKNANQTVVIDNANGNTNSANSNNMAIVNGNTVITNGTNQATNGNANTSQVVVTPGNTNIVSNSNSSTNQTVSTTAKTINDTAVQLKTKQTGHCEALAPADWSFVSNAESTGADLYSPNKTKHAGWGIAGVYKSMYPDVESFLKAWLSYAFTGSFTTSGFTLGTAQDVYEGFIRRDFTTSTSKKGIIIYKTYNFSDPTMYVVSVYMADTANDKWTTDGALPFSVALTIRCVSQLRPATTSIDVSKSDPSKSSDNPEVSLSDKWTEAIMGYENVYSPTTGEHYEAPLNTLWDSGPDGSGYYRSLPGGGYEKLNRGFGSY